MLSAIGITTPDPLVEHGPDGTLYVTDRRPLGRYPPAGIDALDVWAARDPTRVFLAERHSSGGWYALTYEDARARVRRVAQALIDRGLSTNHTLIILSGNSIDHAVLALAAMTVGVPYAPISPAYALQSRDHAALARIVHVMAPSLVYVPDEDVYGPALRSVLPDSVEIVTRRRGAAMNRVTTFDALEEVVDTGEVDVARERVSPENVAKILFTSGSTGRPKGVINTHRMLAANQAQLQAVFPLLTREPPVLCDWLPWSHTAGGNHNFGLTLTNGGTLYIDDGRPLPGVVENSVRNLTEIAVTAHFTVPRTYEVLLPYLERDPAFRARFFSHLRVLFYAGAALSQRHIDAVDRLAEATMGHRLPWVTGLGATETAPFALCTGIVGGTEAGFVGCPVPGVGLKLARVGDRFEARVRGPNVTPGYWRDDDRTMAAFDEEGYYRTGDALRLADEARPERGVFFDGRLGEDFKLSNGTWVRVGALRARVLLALGALAQDVVIAAPHRAFVSALVFPNLTACRALCPDLSPEAFPAVVLADPRVRDVFRARLAELAAEATGSSTRVGRALLVDLPASIDSGELTDKGSISQRAVLDRRASLVDELYEEPPSRRCIDVDSAPARAEVLK